MHHSRRLATVFIVLAAPLLLGFGGADETDEKEARKQFKEIAKRHHCENASDILDFKDAEAAGREMLDFARAHAKEKIGLEATVWACQKPVMSNAAKEAMAFLAEQYVEEEELGKVCGEIDARHGGSQDALEPLFSTVMKKSPYRAVRAAAALYLPRYYKRKKEMIEVEIYQSMLFHRGARVTARLPSGETEAEARKLGLDAEALLKQVLRDYDDVELEGKPIRDAVNAELMELQHFSKDKPVGEIEATDVDGKAIKLSEFRGKVVLLVFSFADHDFSNADFSKLQEKHKGRPFEIVEIVCGTKKEELLKARREGRIAWRCIWDGSLGPIATKNNFHTLPTTFVIDAAGVVRRKFGNPETGLLDGAVNDLIAKTPVE